MLIEDKNELLLLERALVLQIHDEARLQKIRPLDRSITERMAKLDAMALKLYREHFPQAALTHERWMAQRAEESARAS